MNTSVRNLTVGGRSIPLDPPRPPEKPHMLLWIDTETTGISRTDAKILEIGMIVTSLDAAEEGGRFISPVRPDDVSLYDLDPYVLRMHLDNGLLDTVMETEPNEYGYANVARNLSEFLNTEASQYVLHPAAPTWTTTSTYSPTSSPRTSTPTGLEPSPTTGNSI